MKKLVLLTALVFLFVGLAYGQSITMSNSASGSDSDPIIVSITSSGAPAGATITSTVVTTFMGTYVPSWYNMHLTIGGITFNNVGNLAGAEFNHINGQPANGQVVTIRSVDSDNWPDYTEMTLIVVINYQLLPGSPGVPSSPNPAPGATGVPRSQVLSWSFGADTMTYDLKFGPTGAMTQVVTGAAAGASGTYTPPTMNYFGNYSWQVIAHNTNTRLSAPGPVWNFTTEMSPGTVWIGTAATFNDAYTSPCPYGNYFKNERVQYLITAAELTTGGATPGLITSLAFNVYDLNGMQALPNFTIKMGSTTLTELSSTFITGLTTVFHSASFMPAVGYNNHLLTPFAWDGTSSLVIETIYTLTAEYTMNPGVFYTVTPSYKALYYQSDTENASTATDGTLSYSRANMVLDIVSGGSGLVPPILTYPGINATGLPKIGFAFQWSPDLLNGDMPDSYKLYLSDTDVNEDSFFAAATMYPNVTSPFDPGITYNYLEQKFWTVASVAGMAEEYVWPPRRYTIEDNPTIHTFCYNQDFESWPPQNWDLTGGSYSFTQFTGDNLNNWARADYWNQNTGSTDILTSPPILSAAMLQLKFLWSHLYYNEYPADALSVQVSTNQVDWTNIWHKAGANLNSADGASELSPGTGVQEIVYIPASYTNGTDPFWVRFYGYSGWGPDLFIDDFWLCIPDDSGLDVPDVTISLVAGVPTLSWTAITGANSYNIYGANTPNAADPWTFLGNTGLTTYGYTGSDAYHFFKVTATDAAAR